jgi:hypothetical protein
MMVFDMLFQNFQMPCTVMKLRKQQEIKVPTTTGLMWRTRRTMRQVQDHPTWMVLLIRLLEARVP